MPELQWLSSRLKHTVSNTVFTTLQLWLYCHSADGALADQSAGPDFAQWVAHLQEGTGTWCSSSDD